MKVAIGGDNCRDAWFPYGDHDMVDTLQQTVRVAQLDDDQAQDVAQDTFVRAWRALPNFRGDSAFFTWLYRIVTNLAIDLMRKPGRKGAELDEDHVFYCKSRGIPEAAARALLDHAARIGASSIEPPGATSSSPPRAARPRRASTGSNCTARTATCSRRSSRR